MIMFSADSSGFHRVFGRGNRGPRAEHADGEPSSHYQAEDSRRAREEVKRLYTRFFPSLIVVRAFVLLG